MYRPSVKKLCFFLCLTVAGLLFILGIQNRVLSNTKGNNGILNISNARKLAEESTSREEPSLQPSPTAQNASESSIINKGTSKSAPIMPRLVSLDRVRPLDPKDMSIPDESERPWYMLAGQMVPNNTADIKIFPEDLPRHDRIPEQLMYLPHSENSNRNIQESDVPLKKILLWNGASTWGSLKPGRGVFLKEKCPVSSCVLSSSRSEAESADLVIFKDHFSMPTFKRPLHQIWMLYLLECPLHTQMFKFPSVFNWTATYRTDSTIVAPYERWQYYNPNVRTKIQERNYAANKTKQVAWFVSNCGARNGRLNYARQLGKFINVDIYGACGSHRCARTSAAKCFNLLNQDYKFYLAFENSNCKDYITEKFFVNGLGHDILPIAMGAREEDYQRSAPYRSYLHVDQFEDPQQLAKFLHQLDQNDDLYNQYFQWKGTGEFINTKFWCRVCSVLHDKKPEPGRESWYNDINDWWRGEGTCANEGWRLKSESRGKKDRNSLKMKMSLAENTTLNNRLKVLMGA